MQSARPEKFVLGINAAHDKNLSPHSDYFFGERSKEFQLLSKAALETGVECLVYDRKTVDWRSGFVQGWVFDHENHKWVEKTLPLPHATLNRSGGVITAQDRELLEAHSALVNPTGLVRLLKTKSETFRVMLKHGVLHPETVFYEGLVRKGNPQALEDYLSKHGCVYIKPDKGGYGIGVVRVELHGKEAVLKYQHKSFRTSETETIPLEELGQKIGEIISNAREKGEKKGIDFSRLVVQPEIKVHTLEERPWTSRCIVNLKSHAHGKPEFGISGRGVFLGMRGAYGSNFNPEYPVPEEFFSEHYGSQAKEAMKNGDNTAKSAVEALQKELHETSPGALIGHVGVELAFDKHGNATVVEINSAPQLGSLPFKERMETMKAIIHAAEVKARKAGVYPRTSNG